MGIPDNGIELVALPVSNVSMYDASTSRRRPLPAQFSKGRESHSKGVVYISQFVPPHRLSVIENYTQGVGIELRTLEHDSSGRVNLEAASSAEVLARYVEQPNAFGELDEGITV